MTRQKKQTRRILYGENNILTNMEKELVWAKVPFWPPWPGRICTPRPHLMKVPAKPKRIKSKWIFFFGTKNYGWVKEKNLKPYVENRHHFVQNIKKSNFQEAVKRIDEYISDPVKYKFNAENPEIESHKPNISAKPSAKKLFTKKKSVVGVTLFPLKKPKTKRTTSDSKRKGRFPREEQRYIERPAIKVKDEKSINDFSRPISRRTRIITTFYPPKVCYVNITRQNHTRAKTFHQPKRVCKLSGIPRESGKNTPRVQRDTMPCFISEPMHDKPVSDIAGISNSVAKRLTKAGFEKAWSVLGQYLLLKKDSELFKGWLKIYFKASSKQAELCYQDLKDWCDEFL